MDEKQNWHSCKNLIVMLFIFLAGTMATAALAGSPEPDAVMKIYKKAEKTCKQMEQDHVNMKGEHELMFRAWKEKSSPLLTEDEEVIEECKTSLAALKEITEKLEKTVSDDLLKDTLVSDYEKMQGVMEKITIRHKALRKNHEQLFHEMMGH